MFLNVEHLPEGMRDQPPRDVILMERVDSNKVTCAYIATYLFELSIGIRGSIHWSLCS